MASLQPLLRLALALRRHQSRLQPPHQLELWELNRLLHSTRPAQTCLQLPLRRVLLTLQCLQPLLCFPMLRDCWLDSEQDLHQPPLQQQLVPATLRPLMPALLPVPPLPLPPLQQQQPPVVASSLLRLQHKLLSHLLQAHPPWQQVCKLTCQQQAPLPQLGRLSRHSWEHRRPQNHTQGFQQPPLSRDCPAHHWDHPAHRQLQRSSKWQASSTQLQTWQAHL